MTREEAIKTLKENYCAMCAYGSQDMDSCDIRSCDNKDAIKALEQEPSLLVETCRNIAEDYADVDQFVCSECGIELQEWHGVERDEDTGDESFYEYTLKYCPNCGRRIEYDC